jgi:hypothetical protein
MNAEAAKFKRISGGGKQTMKTQNENINSLYEEYKILHAKIKKRDLSFLSHLEENLADHQNLVTALKGRDGLALFKSISAEQKAPNGVQLELRDLPASNEKLTLNSSEDKKYFKLNYGFNPLIRFQGGLHDAPAGQPGPVDVRFEFWFKKTTAGLWLLSAVTTDI